MTNFDHDDQLPFIYWVDGADDANEYCEDCVELAVAESVMLGDEDAQKDGGWDATYEVSEYPASCEKCGKHLSCVVLINSESHYATTEKEWRQVDALLDKLEGIEVENE